MYHLPAGAGCGCHGAQHFAMWSLVFKATRRGLVSCGVHIETASGNMCRVDVSTNSPSRTSLHS